MTDDNYGEMLDSRKRVLAFVAEWQRRASYGNIDPERIYTLGTSDEPLELRVSDLLELSAVIEQANESSLMEWSSSVEDYYRNSFPTT